MKEKFISCFIVALVAYGTIFFGSLAGVGGEGNLMPAIFFLFIAAIIALQIVPAMMLFGALVREFFRGKKAQVRTGKES